MLWVLLMLNCSKCSVVDFYVALSLMSLLLSSPLDQLFCCSLIPWRFILIPILIYWHWISWRVPPPQSLHQRQSPWWGIARGGHLSALSSCGYSWTWRCHRRQCVEGLQWLVDVSFFRGRQRRANPWSSPRSGIPDIPPRRKQSQFHQNNYSQWTYVYTWLGLSWVSLSWCVAQDLVNSRIPIWT